jgi:hypothetical protein
MRHPLVQRRELAVADVLDETFIGLNPSVESKRGAFWSLDDHIPPMVQGQTPKSLVWFVSTAKRWVVVSPATVASLAKRQFASQTFTLRQKADLADTRRHNDTGAASCPVEGRDLKRRGV